MVYNSKLALFVLIVNVTVSNAVLGYIPIPDKAWSFKDKASQSYSFSTKEQVSSIIQLAKKEASESSTKIQLRLEFCCILNSEMILLFPFLKSTEDKLLSSHLIHLSWEL